MKKRIFTMLLVAAMLLGVFGQSPANAYDIVIGSSAYNGTIWHYDVSVGMANPGTGAGLTVLCYGLLPIDDVEVLPDGNIIVGATVFGGAAYHFDMATMLANPGQIPLDFQDPNIIGSGQTMLGSNFGSGVDPNLCFIDDIEVLPDANVVVAGKIWGGAIYHWDVAAKIADPTNAYAGMTQLLSGLATGALDCQHYTDIEVLPDGNMVYGAELHIAPMDRGCLNHADLSDIEHFNYYVHVTQLGSAFGDVNDHNIPTFFDIEVLPDANIVVGGPALTGVLYHFDIPARLNGVLGDGYSILGCNFGLEADPNLLSINEIEAMDDGNILIDGSIYDGALFHYDIAEALADPNLGVGHTLIRVELGSVYDIEMLPDANAFLGTSSLGGRLHYLDIASDPNINNATLTDFIGGLGEIYDVKSLPDGNVLIAASNIGGAIYHLDLTDISAGVPVVLLQAGLGTIYEVEILPTTGQTCVDKPDADMDGDCDVDFKDFAVFASEWLDCGTDSGVCP